MGHLVTLLICMRNRCQLYFFGNLFRHVVLAALLPLGLAASACSAPDRDAEGASEQAQPRRSATLRWAAATPTPDGYHVYRAMKQGGPYEKLTSEPVRNTEYSDTAVHAGQTYYYAVTAVDSKQRESAKSQEIRVTVPGPR